MKRIGIIVLFWYNVRKDYTKGVNRVKNKRLVLFGFGTVAQAVYKLLTTEKSRILKAINQSRTKIDYDVVSIVVRDVAKYQAEFSDISHLFTTEWPSEADYDVAIELVSSAAGGDIMTQALKSGKDVVSANKLALYQSAGQLEALAVEHGRILRYEGAVAGAIPILQIMSPLASGEIQMIRGILNGSTNYILTRLFEAEKLSVDEAITEASEKGYLEADPTLDVGGFDALYKLGILIYLTTGHYPTEAAIERVGIDMLSDEAIAEAKNANKTYKLVAEADFKTGKYRVTPQLLESTDPLYGIDGSLNAVTLTHQYAGELTLQGPGAGGLETASAVIGDLIYIMREGA